MIPHWFPALVILLGTFRLVRIIGWDYFPPIVSARDWITGALFVTNGSTNARMGLTGEPVERMVVHRRPLLAKLIECAWCLGFWISLLVYLAWRWHPGYTLTVLAPFALSAAVGLLARNLDP